MVLSGEPTRALRGSSGELSMCVERRVACERQLTSAANNQTFVPQQNLLSTGVTSIRLYGSRYGLVKTRKLGKLPGEAQNTAPGIGVAVGLQCQVTETCEPFSKIGFFLIAIALTSPDLAAYVGLFFFSLDENLKGHINQQRRSGYVGNVQETLDRYVATPDLFRERPGDLWNYIL